MAEAQINCGICDSHQCSRPAVIWCLDCTEGICSVSREQHDLFKLTRSHSVIPIGNYQQLPSDISQITDICSEHDDKYVMYCQNHLKPCCRTCVVRNHKTCQDVANLEDVVQNYKSSFALQEIENTLKECLENITIIKKDRDTNLKSIEAENAKALDDIERVRRKINQHLDYLQDKIKAELKQKTELAKKTIHDTLTSINEEETFINEQIQTVSKIKEYATDFQAFFYSSLLVEQIQTTENRILELSKDESCSTSQLIVKFEKSIERFVDQFTSFGSIDIGRSPSLVVLSKRKEAEKQLITTRPLTKQIEDINLTIDKTLDKFSSCCYGCCILSDGRMAFTDLNAKGIRILNTNGSEDVTIDTPGFLLDVTQINDTTLAVSCPGYGIHLIDMRKKAVSKTLLSGATICGITSRDEDHLIYCELKTGVRMIRISDGIVTNIVKEKLPYNFYVTSFGDNVIHTNNETNTVTCHDISGKKKWAFKDESVLRDPRGVTTDNSGNVYVACYDSGNILIISAVGQNHKEIKCGLKFPYSLDYDKANNTLLAVSRDKNKAVLLKKK